MAAAAEERLLSEGEGGAPGSARLSPPPLSQSPEAPTPLEQPPQSNTLMGLPIVAIESILSFLSYDETSQLRLNAVAFRHFKNSENRVDKNWQRCTCKESYSM